MKKLFKNKYFFVLLLLFVIFLPTTITLKAKSEVEAIVTAIGMDYLEEDDEIELSIQVVVPTPSAQYSQQLSVINTKADTISKGMSDLSLRLGKTIAFPHCKVIAFNEKMCEKGIDDDLDYIMKNKANEGNIVLLETKDSAKELLNSISDINNSLHFGLNNSGTFNKEYLYGVQLDLANFYRLYVTDDASSLMGNVSLESAKDVGMISIPSSEGGGEGSSNGGSSGGQEQKTVVNKGESSLLKKGKKIMSLSAEQTMSFNWFLPDADKGYIFVEGVNDDFYKDAKVGIEINKKVTRVKTSFEGETPIYTLDLDLYLTVTEIIQDGKNINNYRYDMPYLSNALKQKIIEKINNNVEEAVTIARQNNCDIMQATKTINKYHHKKYQKYKAQNEGKELDGITFKTKINIKEIL